MNVKILVMMSMACVVMSCDLKKKESAQHTIDSLRSELVANRKVTETMVEVGALMDSIDASRKVLRTHMLEGTSYENFTSRMREINAYVQKTEKRIADLEKSARRSSNNASYTAAIKKLKDDLETRHLELAALKEQVNQYKNQNENLVQTVSLQKAEIAEKLSQIKFRQEETAKLEQQVTQLMIQSKLNEGEAYFSRAEAIEETANRTHFAPKKKKNSRKQALELYKLAYFYGKEEAQPKIMALETKL